jgi:hypothetical protein
MPELLVSTFDVSDLSTSAICILSAAVRYAHSNQQIKLHAMRINDFCHLAGMPVITTERFFVLLKEARKALVVVEVIDTSLPQSDGLPYSSWRVFNLARIAGSQFTFEICRYTFAEFVLATLPSKVSAAYRTNNRGRNVEKPR